jgi:Zn-dependent protease
MMSYNNISPFNRGRFRWQDVRRQFDPQTPRGRLVIFVLILLIILFALELRDVTQDNVVDFIARKIGIIFGLLMGFALHEWAHASAAYWLGGWRALPDPSRLTLDPRSHLDPLGTLLALLAGFGWAKPVPINPSAFYPKERQNMLLVVIAGPVMNLILATGFAIILRMLVVGGAIEKFESRFVDVVVIATNSEVLHFFFLILTTIVSFNILLFFFNLIPLYPLDGWRILTHGLPDEQGYQLRQYEVHSMYILYFLILIGLVNDNLSVIGRILGPLVDTVFKLMTGFDGVVRLP